MKTTMKTWFMSALWAMAAMLASGPVLAMGGGDAEADGEIEEIGELADLFQAWMAGDLGLLITMVGLLVAVVMIAARASLMPVLFVLGLAIILGWGPGMAAGILASEVTPEIASAMGR